MTSFQRILRQARRRTLLHHALRRMGWGLMAAAALALALLLLDRLTGLKVHESIHWGLGVAGLTAGLIHALLFQADRLQLAVQLDRGLRLKDRFATAATLPDLSSNASGIRQPSIDPTFAELVRLDAQRVAERIDVRPATPIHVSRIWFAVIPLAALWWAGHAFLPQVSWGDATDRAPAGAHDAAQARAEAQHISESIAKAVSELPRDQFVDERGKADLETLDRLAQQLAEKPLSPNEVASAREESAAILNEMSERMARQSERELAAADEVARRFAGLDKAGAPAPPMSTREFTDALKRGDFGQATKEIEEMLADPDLPPNDRVEAAQHLENLASRLDQSDQPLHAAPEENREQLSQALRDEGLDEQSVRDMLEGPPSSEDEVRRELSQKNVENESARPLARDIHQQREQKQIDDQARQMADDLKQSLRRAADELKSSPQPERQPSDQTESSAEKRDAAQQQEQVKSDKKTPDPSATGEPEKDTPDGQQSAPQPAAAPQSQPDSPLPPDSAGAPPAEAQQQQEQEQQQRDQESDTKSPPIEGEDDQGPQSSPVEGLRRLSERRENAQQQKQTVEQLRKLAREFMERTTPEQRRELMDQLETLARQQRESPDQPDQADQAPTPDGQSQRDLEQLSRELNDAGREMLDRMSPEEKRQLAERVQRMMKEDSAPPQTSTGPGGDPRGSSGDQTENQSPPPLAITGTEDLDLRGKQTADRIVAQWLDDQLKAAPGAQRGSSSSSAPPVRQAQDVAERAVSESAVQKRYHKAIQRYFGRLNETMEKAASEKKETAEK